jgi:hypothetical protein
VLADRDNIDALVRPQEEAQLELFA